MRFLLLIALASYLIGCESTGVIRGRKAYKEYFKETLKDPESLRIYKEIIIYSDDVSAKFQVEIGAKNSYGGYVRETFCFHTIGDKVVQSGGATLFDELPVPKSEYEPALKSNKESDISPGEIKEYKYKLSEYGSYISDSEVMADFSVGEVLILKSPILAAKNGTWYKYLKDDIDRNDEDGFNEWFGEYYKLLPKGTKAEVMEIFDAPQPDTFTFVETENREEWSYCLRIKVLNGDLKGQELFIGRFLQK
jgi:hypothetical protein